MTSPFEARLFADCINIHKIYFAVFVAYVAVSGQGSEETDESPRS